MSRLNSRMHPLLNSNVVDSLYAKNIYSVLNFIQTEIKLIAAITNLQYKDILGIRQHLINKHSAITRNGFNYYNELVANSVLFPTGITSLDAILLGGLSTGTIYEICGLPSTGKTQFNLTLTKNVLQTSNTNVYYIDTKKDFSAKRLKAMLDDTGQQVNYEKIMSRVFIKQIFTVYDLVNTLYEIKSLLSSKKLRARLIIIDSLPPLFYSISNFSERYSLINSMVNIMQVLAKEFHTVIVVTNITTMWYDNYGVENRITEKVSLGKYWFNIPNTRLMIKKSVAGTSDYLITIVKSNRLLEGSECVVKLTESGIV
ncbi:hypothetical protein FQR65_LT06193 [Abscondita terminalis]|nr:hypothetical protein FQR65_LT06193 [Abscondita terminalis]